MSARLRACLTLLVTSLVLDTVQAQTIYQYRDPKGAIHLSNRRLSEEYQPFEYLRVPIGADRAKVMAFVRYYSRRYRVNPDLIQAMVEVESGFTLGAVSPKGAEGLMQIMPGTGRDLGLVDPFDGAKNLEAGIRYFKSLLDTFGSTRLALAAYNAGPARVAKAGTVPDIPETREYVDRVLARCGLR
jgi:soluble lytic murein transglycosylase-like protein